MIKFEFDTLDLLKLMPSLKFSFLDFSLHSVLLYIMLEFSIVLKPDNIKYVSLAGSDT